MSKMTLTGSVVSVSFVSSLLQHRLRYSEQQAHVQLLDHVLQVVCSTLARVPPSLLPDANTIEIHQRAPTRSSLRPLPSSVAPLQMFPSISGSLGRRWVRLSVRSDDRGSGDQLESLRSASPVQGMTLVWANQLLLQQHPSLAPGRRDG
jgi:hypothetical protein